MLRSGTGGPFTEKGGKAMVVMVAARGHNIGRKLRELRRERALTQKELSDLSGVHPVTISDLEREQANASAKNTRKLAAALNVEAKDLMEDEITDEHRRKARDFREEETGERQTERGDGTGGSGV
jgi:transcriptional regulator with XRE-family HTH domain